MRRWNIFVGVFLMFIVWQVCVLSHLAHPSSTSTRLQQNASGEWSFPRFEPWTIPRDGPDELPYAGDVEYLNATHVRYRGGPGSLYASCHSADNIASEGALGGNCGIDAKSQTRHVAHLDASKRDHGCLSAHAPYILVFDFVDSGYWGHAIENLWPRFAGAAEVYGRPSAIVIPQSSILSPHTSQLADALGVEILRRIPGTQTRLVWACDLPSYHYRLRRQFARTAQYALGLLPLAAHSSPPSILYLSRAHGAAHRRSLGARLNGLEAILATDPRVRVLDDIGRLALRDLARQVASARGLAGASGSAMFHMTWLHPSAHVFVFFPVPSGTQYGYLWLHAHSLGLNYHHVRSLEEWTVALRASLE